MDSGSSSSGLAGNGFKAPGEVRYVISCKHLDVSIALRAWTYCLRYSLLLARDFGSLGTAPTLFQVFAPELESLDDFDMTDILDDPACPFILRSTHRISFYTPATMKHVPPSSRSLAPLPPESLPSFSLLLDRSSSCNVASLLGAIPLALPAVPTDFVLFVSSAFRTVDMPFLTKRKFQHLDASQQVHLEVLGRPALAFQ